MSYETARPWAASYVIARQAGKIAMVLRENTNWMSGYYGLPSGKKEREERFSRAGIREGDEEVGITIRPKNLQPLLVVHRYEQDSKMEWVDVYFEALEWEGDVRNAEPDVHGEVAFFTPDDLPENTVPSVRFAIEAIEAGKTYVEYGWEE